MHLNSENAYSASALERSQIPDTPCATPPPLDHASAEIVRAYACLTVNDNAEEDDDDEEVEVFEADEDGPRINPDRELAADRLEALRPTGAFFDAYDARQTHRKPTRSRDEPQRIRPGPRRPADLLRGDDVRVFPTRVASGIGDRASVSAKAKRIAERGAARSHSHTARRDPTRLPKPRSTAPRCSPNRFRARQRLPRGRPTALAALLHQRRAKAGSDDGSVTASGRTRRHRRCRYARGPGPADTSRSCRRTSDPGHKPQCPRRAPETPRGARSRPSAQTILI